MFRLNKMTSLTIDLESDNADLLFYIGIIQSVIKQNQDKDIAWALERKQKRKKKTVEEIITEIEEDIKMEMDNITDANIEIQNLELKRSEVEKLEPKIPVDYDALIQKVKKIKIVKKKKEKVSIDTEPLLIDY